MRWIALLGLVMGSTACDGEGTGPDGPGPAGLGNVLDELSGDNPPCEEFVDGDGLTCRGIEGATVFFAAEADIDGDQINGAFYFAHFANESWQETNEWSSLGLGERCLITWQMTGTISDTNDVACGACEKGITYSLSLDNSQTDCPAGKVADVSSSVQDANWALDIDGDEVKSWDTKQEWAPNGRYKENKGFILWSDGACEWYGSGECT